MGELIFLSEVLDDRSRPVPGRGAFFFAFDCPLCYLAAERVERALGEIDWVPVLTSHSHGRDLSEPERAHCAAEQLSVARQEALTLKLPLVEPHRYPFEARPITRAAAYAAECGVGAMFALAGMRLAFCGGYDLSHPDVIGEAADVVGLSASEALVAARASRYDGVLEATSRGLESRGLSAPAIRIGRRWFAGVDVVAGASTSRALGADGDAPLHAG